MRTLRRVTTILAILVLVGAGCSGDDDEASEVSAGSDGTAQEAPVSIDGEVTDKGTEDLTADGAAPELELEVDDNYFEPTFVQTEAGATVKVTLVNEGDRTHTFTTDDGTDEELEPGASAETEVTVPDTGALPYFCRLHRSGGMQGAFFIESVTGSTDPASDTPSTAAGLPGY